MLNDNPHVLSLVDGVVIFQTGMSKYEQFKVLKNGVEVCVASPGRLIDLIKMKG
eukprot:SAG31_NODE_3049_length_4745_cov_3.873870_2_plen_54_part_00